MAALHVLAYGVATKQVDEYVRIGETTTRRCLEAFVEGTCNDINVLDRSNVFNDIFEGRAPPTHFSVNNHEYDMRYYLTDGIYPEWATFNQSISLPQGPKAQLFAQRQESARKDVERAFGVLQAIFAIVRAPCNLWDPYLIENVMKASIILHNMIVEDERDTYANQYDESQWEDDQSDSNDGSRWKYSRDQQNDIEEYIRMRTRVRDSNKFPSQSRFSRKYMEKIWTE